MLKELNISVKVVLYGLRSDQLDGTFHLMIIEFKLDANRNIDDEIRFGPVLSIEE